MSMSRRPGRCAQRPGAHAHRLYMLAETFRHLGILVQPFVPDAAATCSTSLPCRRRRAILRPRPGAVGPGHGLPKPVGIFPRYVEEAAP